MKRKIVCLNRETRRVKRQMRKMKRYRMLECNYNRGVYDMMEWFLATVEDRPPRYIGYKSK